MELTNYRTRRRRVDISTATLLYLVSKLLIARPNRINTPPFHTCHIWYTVKEDHSINFIQCVIELLLAIGPLALPESLAANGSLLQDAGGLPMLGR